MYLLYFRCNNIGSDAPVLEVNDFAEDLSAVAGLCDGYAVLICCSSYDLKSDPDDEDTGQVDRTETMFQARVTKLRKTLLRLLHQFASAVFYAPAQYAKTDNA